MRTNRIRNISSKVLLYVRCSTEEQSNSGAGIEAQRAVLQRECELRGWSNVEWIEDAGYSGKSLDRPGMQAAISMLTSGEAGVLAAAKLDRVSRSVVDASRLMTLANDAGFSLVLLDIGVDTTTAAGRLVANVLASVAEWERDIIRERTKAALAAKRASGTVLGRPRELNDDIRTRILRMRNAGHTFARIADTLTADKVPTARKGRWTAATIYKVVNAPAQPHAAR